jgi:hypothetical protein
MPPPGTVETATASRSPHRHSSPAQTLLLLPQRHRLRSPLSNSPDPIQNSLSSPYLTTNLTPPVNRQTSTQNRQRTSFVPIELFVNRSGEIRANLKRQVRNGQFTQLMLYPSTATAMAMAMVTVSFVVVGEVRSEVCLKP